MLKEHDVASAVTEVPDGRRVRSTCVQPIRTRLQGNLPGALPLPCIVEDAELRSKRTTQAELLGNGHALLQQGC